MLTDSLTYLKHSDDVWKTSILGGIFLLFGFLLLPLFLVWGYVIRVVDRTTHGDDEAPVFDDWGTMMADGAKTSVIVLGYALIPLVVGSVLVTGVWIATAGTPGSIGTAGFLLSGLVTIAVAVAAAYVIPAGIANFAAERRIRAGFEFETLRPVLSSGTYVTAWLIALGIVLVGGAVTGILNAIPFVGTVLGAMVGFYALVAAYYVIGHTWGDLQEIEIDEAKGDPSADRPAV